MVSELTNAIVGLDSEILLACIIVEGKVEEAFVRSGVPLANEQRASELTLQTAIVMSIVLKSQDYLGKLKFVHFHMEYADGLYFALADGKTLAIMLEPQDISSNVILKIQSHLERSVVSVGDRKKC